MNYLKINEEEFNKEFNRYPTGIKSAYNVLKENPDKVNNNEWGFLIRKNPYVIDILIKANIDFMEYLGCIPSYSFYDNSWLEEIIIPNGVDAIEENAFQKNSNLTKITIPLSVKKIGNRAFAGCPYLKEIKYEGTTNQFYETFSYFSNLTDDSKLHIHIICTDGDFMVW